MKDEYKKYWYELLESTKLELSLIESNLEYLNKHQQILSNRIKDINKKLKENETP